MRLMVSNRREAARFARAFDAKDLRQKRRKTSPTGEASGRPSSNGRKEREEYRSAEELEKEARLARARKALGVPKEASAEQIGVAYRELARTHHPDKVASLEPEVREYSEQRMKEINAAYAELGAGVARSRVEGDRHEEKVPSACDGRLRPALGLRGQDGDGESR